MRADAAGGVTGQPDNMLLGERNRALDDGRMLQADKKGSQRSPSGLWAQCPEGLWSSDFPDNIQRFQDSVKRFRPKEKQIRKANHATQNKSDAQSKQKHQINRGERMAKLLDNGGVERNEYEVIGALWDAMDHGDSGWDNLIRAGQIPKYVTNLLGVTGDFYIYRDHAYENMVSEKDAVAAGRPITRGRNKIHFHNLGIDVMTETNHTWHLLRRKSLMTRSKTENLPYRWQLYMRLRDLGMSPSEKLRIVSPLNGKTYPEKERLAKEILERLEKERDSTK